MDDIKIFVCCHRPSYVPQHRLLLPIQLGASIADSRFTGYLHDDDGENISEKNKAYCELTAQYWAWKNCPAEYYGFFHYRRYLYPDAHAKRPYIYAAAPTEAALAALNFDRISELVFRHDIVLPKRENMHVSAKEHYSKAPFHHAADLQAIEIIAKAIDPGFTSAFAEYISGTELYFGNIFIMRREIFDDYCSWLFSILDEFDRQKPLYYEAQDMRVDGYLAERLLGVYCTRYRDSLRCLELPRVHFEPDAARMRQKQLLNCLLPPGTKRRAVVKGWR